MKAANLSFLPEGWRTVTRVDYNEASRTHTLALSLISILGRHSGLHTMTGAIEPTMPTLKPKRKNGNSSQAELVQPFELADRLGNADKTNVEEFRKVLETALRDCIAVINAHEILKEGTEPKLLDLETIEQLEAINTTPEIDSFIENGIERYEFAEVEVSLHTTLALVKALGLETPKRNYKEREISTKKKAKSMKNITKIDRLKERRNKKKTLLA